MARRLAGARATTAKRLIYQSLAGVNRAGLSGRALAFVLTQDSRPRVKNVMSTCARCGGALTHDHTCHGTAMAAFQWALDVVVGGLIGAAIGLVLFGHLLAAITGESYFLLGLAAGSAVGIAVARTLRKLARASGLGFQR